MAPLGGLEQKLQSVLPEETEKRIELASSFNRLNDTVNLTSHASQYLTGLANMLTGRTFEFTPSADTSEMISMQYAFAEIFLDARELSATRFFIDVLDTLPSEEIPLLFLKGSLAIHAQQYTDAISFFQKGMVLLKHKPDVHHFTLGLAAAYMGLGDDATAIKTYQRIAETSSYALNKHYGLAMMYYRQTNCSRARIMANKLLSSTPIESLTQEMARDIIQLFEKNTVERDSLILRRTIQELRDDLVPLKADYWETPNQVPYDTAFVFTDVDNPELAWQIFMTDFVFPINDALLAPSIANLADFNYVIYPITPHDKDMLVGAGKKEVVGFAHAIHPLISIYALHMLHENLETYHQHRHALLHDADVNSTLNEIVLDQLPIDIFAGCPISLVDKTIPLPVELFGFKQYVQTIDTSPSGCVYNSSQE